MSKNQKNQKIKIRLSGRNIYTDKKNRTIYYDGLTKQGYLIEKKDENKIVFFKNRIVIILLPPSCAPGHFSPGRRPHWPVCCFSRWWRSIIALPFSKSCSR